MLEPESWFFAPDRSGQFQLPHPFHRLTHMHVHEFIEADLKCGRTERNDTILDNKSFTVLDRDEVDSGFGKEVSIISKPDAARI